MKPKFIGMTIVAALMLLPLSGGISHAANLQNGYVPFGVEPNPTLNGNVTWSTFYSGWNPLEYSNGTGNQTLNASLSQFYINPLNIDPANIIAPGVLQGDKVAGKVWDNMTSWAGHSSATGGSVINYGIATVNGQQAFYFNINASGAAYNGVYATYDIPFTSLPSSNLNYSYLTIAGSLTISSSLTGAQASLVVGNGSSANQAIKVVNGTAETAVQSSIGTNYITPGQAFYVSMPLGDIAQFTAKNSPQLVFQPNLGMPQSSGGAVMNLTITGMALTTASLTVGTQLNKGTVSTPTGTYGNINLRTLSPDYNFNEIANGGYTAAISQNLSQAGNATVATASITQGNYIKQAIYSGNLELPTAPGLIYQGFNLSQRMGVPGGQYQALSINGASYLNSIAKKNSSYEFNITGINPNAATSYFSVVDYTQAQWDSISSPPGLFSIAGWEFTWYELVSLIGSILGLTGGGIAVRRRAQLRRMNK